MMMMIIISINLRSEKNVAFKGEVRQIFLLAQSFYRPQTKRSLNGQFSPKSPEVGQKSGQGVKNSRNKNQTANSGQQLL